MANILTNPWSFDSTDVVTATPSASPAGFVLQADGTVLMTTGAAHGLVAGNYCTVIGATNSAYNGGYRVRYVPSVTTAYLVPEHKVPAGTAASGGGTVGKCQYEHQFRAHQLTWQQPPAAGNAIDIRNRIGKILWQSTAPDANSQQNPMNLAWVEGLTIFQIDGGVVIVTVD